MEKRYDFKAIEPQMQQLWNDHGVYKFNKAAPGEVYAIDTPPPTVSGSLHIGHLFSYVQAEMIARFRRMQGYNVFYPFGFDDNGLPTERLVEREQGIRANELPRSEFTQKCQATAAKYEDEFKALWQSLGVSADWSLCYQTVSPQSMATSQKLFLDLVQKGKAYAKESPVLWCVECQTSIAQAELDSADAASTFNTIPFMVEGKPLHIATTRPELLYGCVCLFVHPEDARYAHLVGKQATVPLYGYDVPILTDEKVAIDKGTGAVMCCTFGDQTDVEWYNTYNLPYRRVIMPNGHIADDVPYIANMYVTKARKTIIAMLDEQGLLVKSENITHAVQTHERCGKHVEIIPSRQWYIDVMTDRDKFLELGEKINWYPANMQNRYNAWVENLKWDWCISRQRYFGVPFPVWYCADCGTAVFAKAEQLPVNPLEVDYEGTCACGCTQFTPESAVLDTWATSSITPQINELSGGPVPMGMRPHAHEIIRTWTFYTIVRSWYHTGDLPWNDLMISGFVLAKKGEKISKSKGNSQNDPATLIATHSADVLRYWAANARLGTDTYFDTDELQIARRFITKLWNACKFAIGHLGDYAPAEITLPVDKWMVARVDDVLAKAKKSLYEYEIGTARHEIDALFWHDLCDNYIEIVKDRLYYPENHGEAERKSGQAALYYTLREVLKMYAIYVPHVTDYLYQNFFKQHEGAKSLHQLQWAQPAEHDPQLLAFGEALKEQISAMRKVRSEQNLSRKDPLASYTIDAGEFAVWFELTKKDIQACENIGEVNFS